jgi:MoaA/NifB/PqqE/SkfB family radical SAM enzyme
VIDQLADLGCRRVHISGGEPLMYQDVHNIIQRVRERGMSCTLVSNGLLVRKMIDQLSRLNTLTLSLDGVESAHDAVRGEGVFDAVKDAIAAARGAGIPVKINAVLSTKSASTLDELVAFIDKENLGATLNIMRFGETDLWGNAATIKQDDEETRKTLERLAGLAQTKKWMLFSKATYDYAARWRDYSRDRYEADELPPDDPLLLDGPRCQAGRYHLIIFPDGKAYPCTPTFGRIPGANAIIHGVEGAWRQLHDHRCVACYAPCLVEKNYLLSLKPRVLLNFVVKHLAKFH